MHPQRDRLCVALDGSDRRWISSMSRALAPAAGWLKIGLEAFVAHGPDLVRELVSSGGRVFLDLKLHDIPNTVKRATASCAASGASLVTVHAAGGRAMLEAAMQGACEGSRGERPKVVAVTVLTSLDDAALRELGLGCGADVLVSRWARMATAAGVDGVVCSAREVSAVRSACGPRALLVTPGIRPSWSSAQDQRRVVTPRQAVARGADLLVIGRPITNDTDPVAAAGRILDEMAAGLESTPSDPSE